MRHTIKQLDPNVEMKKDLKKTVSKCTAFIFHLFTHPHTQFI